MEITSIKLALIDEDKDQPRYQFNQEALEELANSIKEIGLLSPIKVRDMGNGRYKIIYGNRRYKASQMVGLESIPCIVSDSADELEIYYEQIAENLTREDFSPIEEAEAFHKLMNDDVFRSSIKLLSSKLGKTESYIKNKLELLKFGTAVKKLIVSGTQISKDRLTEDQLMPLKDLPIEYRDTLALTTARDELPVSDVKKIAKLFKDQSISDTTKQKLMLKDGRGLIETWSVFEQNRKEKLAREKQQQEAAATKLAQQQQKTEQANEQPAGHAEQVQKQPSGVNQGIAGSEAALATSQVGHTHVKEAAALSAHAPLHSSNSVQSSAPAFNVFSALDKDNYLQTLEQAHQEASALLEQVLEGRVHALDACEQLASDMIIELHRLQELWRSIQRAGQA